MNNKTDLDDLMGDLFDNEDIHEAQAEEALFGTPLESPKEVLRPAEEVDALVDAPDEADILGALFTEAGLKNDDFKVDLKTVSEMLPKELKNSCVLVTNNEVFALNKAPIFFQNKLREAAKVISKTLNGYLLRGDKGLSRLIESKIIAPTSTIYFISKNRGTGIHKPLSKDHRIKEVVLVRANKRYKYPLSMLEDMDREAYLQYLDLIERAETIFLNVIQVHKQQQLKKGSKNGNN